LRFDPDPASKPLDYFFADCKPDSASRTIMPMQAFERLEDLRLVFGRNANAIVATGKHPRVTLIGHTDVDYRRVRTAIVNGIANQVLKYLGQMSSIDAHRRKQVIGDCRSRFRDRGVKILKG
jgi:hypothetical protein